MSPTILMGSAAANPDEWRHLVQNGRAHLAATAICQNSDCNGPISFIFKITDPSSTLLFTPGILCSYTLTQKMKILRMWPPEPRPSAPAYLPPNIEVAFLEAEKSRLSRIVTAANIMFRRSLELATKDKGRDLDQTGNLAQRIRILSDAGRLTPEIRDWATHIRLIGNEAAHDEETPTVESVEALANLTRMTLVYLYEMPERVRLLREASESEGA